MKTLLMSVLLCLALPWSAAQAEESAFAAYAAPLRFATATHLLELRLEALTMASEAPEAGEAAAGTEEGEEDEGPPIPLLALFAGSLSAADTDLLHALETDLDDARRLAADGDRSGLQEVVGQAQRRLVRARGLLVPDELAGTPVFRAAVIARLAVSERGLGEGYEEAAGGEISAYPLAWLTLQRVSTLWDELKPDIGTATEEVRLALDELNGIMPSPQPPDRFRDPEDAEGAALDLVFALEGVLGRPLVIRGFGSALELMQRQADAACAAVREGRGRLALENALAARITYGGTLAPTLATLAPDVHAEFSALWGELDSLRSGNGAEETCTALQDAIARAGETFG